MHDTNGSATAAVNPALDLSTNSDNGQPFVIDEHTILRDSSTESIEESKIVPDMTGSEFSSILTETSNNDARYCEDSQEARSDMERKNPTTEIKPSQKERIFRCRHCHFEINNKVEFWRHARSHIKPEKLLECQQCEFVTEYRHHLEYHVRNHLNSKPFSCDRCPYRCVNRSMLNSHMKSHTNVCHYRCQDCSYATKYCHSLKTHLRKNGHRPAPGINLDTSKLLPSSFLSRMSPKQSRKCNTLDKNMAVMSGMTFPAPPVSFPQTLDSPAVGSILTNSFTEAANASPDFEHYFSQLSAYLQSSLPQSHHPNNYQKPSFPPSPVLPYLGYFSRPSHLYGFPQWFGQSFPTFPANNSAFTSPVASPPEKRSDEFSPSEDMAHESTLLDLRVKSKKDQENLLKSKSGRLDSICEKLNNAKARDATRSPSQTFMNFASQISKASEIKECPHCDILFKEDFMFRHHMSFHSDSDPLTCAMCKIRCPNKIDFFTHFSKTPHV